MAAVKIFNDHLVATLLEDEERDRNIILLELIGNLQGNKWTVNLDVIFQSVDVCRRSVFGTRVDYHIGCTGASVIVKSQDGVIISHTQDCIIPVNYSNQVTIEDELAIVSDTKGITDIPAYKAKVGKSTKKEHSVSFKNTERILVASRQNDKVKWNIEQPNSQKAVRDYLLGNYLLTAEIEWQEKYKSGFISVRPADVSFFDHNRVKMDRWKSLLMQYRLWKESKKLKNTEGLQFKYEIHE